MVQVDSHQTHITVQDRLSADFKGSRHTAHNNHETAGIGKTLISSSSNLPAMGRDTIH